MELELDVGFDFLGFWSSVNPNPNRLEKVQEGAVVDLSPGDVQGEIVYEEFLYFLRMAIS